MPISPENIDRNKKILLAATAIALGSIALKKNKTVGDKIFHASFWEASQTVFADVIDSSKGMASRMAARVRFSNTGELIDVDEIEFDSEADSETEPSEKTLSIYEEGFLDTPWPE